jgi:SAM-dependent methyltransferase
VSRRLPRPVRSIEELRPRQAWSLEAGAPAAYERYLVPALFASWAERLLGLVAPGPGERVLDVACGTGTVARQAAVRVGADGEVAGLDVNQGMLAVARAAAAHVRPAIDWRAGDAASLPFPDGAFDVVLCQQGLQYVAHPVVALHEMRRVLASRGRLGLAVWRPIRHSPGFAALARVLSRHLGADAAATMRAPFAGPDAATLCQLAIDAGFGDVRLRVGVGTVRFPSAAEFLRRQAASSPLGPQLAAAGEDARGALARDLDQLLAAWTDDNGVGFPIQAWLATAYR